MLVRLRSLLLDHSRVRVRRSVDGSGDAIVVRCVADDGWSPGTARVERVPAREWLGVAAPDAVVDEGEARRILAMHERRIGDDVTVHDMRLLRPDKEPEGAPGHPGTEARADA